MVCCSAYGCSNRSDGKEKKNTRQEQKITFHRFPKDVEPRRKWIRAVRRVSWVPNENSVLCSQHFTEDCFDRSYINITRLYKHAVPTVFPAFSNQQHSTQTKRRGGRKGKLPILPEESLLLTEEDSELENPDPSTSSSNQEEVMLTSRTTSFSPDQRLRPESPRASNIRQMMQEKIQGYKNKIKILQQNKRREVKKVTRLKNIIKCLKQKNLMLEENFNHGDKRAEIWLKACGRGDLQEKLKQTEESVSIQNDNFLKPYHSENHPEIISNVGEQYIITTDGCEENYNLDEPQIDTGQFEGDNRENADQTSSAIEKPYFKSIKCYLSDCNKFTEVCRICFRSLMREEEVAKLNGDETSIEDQTRIKNMLKLVLPDMDLGMFHNIIMCTKCTELLAYSYQFKQTWLSTETKLQKILEKKRAAFNEDADLVIAKKEVKNTNWAEIDHDYARVSVNQKQQTDEEPEMTDKLLSSSALPEEVGIFRGEPSMSNLIANTSANCQRRVMIKNVWGRGSYLCEKCGCIFSRPSRLRRHLLTHFKREKVKKTNEHKCMCEICGKLFLTRSALKSHCQVHANPKEPKCPTCGKEFNHVQAVRSHIYNVHTSRTFQCHLCGKTLSNPGSFQRHLLLHNTNKKMHMCRICDKKFSTRLYVRKHQRVHVMADSWTCTRCGKCLKYEKSLQKHINLVHMKQGEFMCEYCNKPFWKKESLLKHRIRVHGGSHQVQKVQQDEGLENNAFPSGAEVGTAQCIVYDNILVTC